MTSLLVGGRAQKGGAYLQGAGPRVEAGRFWPAGRRLGGQRK